MCVVCTLAQYCFLELKGAGIISPIRKRGTNRALCLFKKKKIQYKDKTKQQKHSTEDFHLVCLCVSVLFVISMTMLLHCCASFARRDGR